MWPLTDTNLVTRQLECSRKELPSCIHSQDILFRPDERVNGYEFEKRLSTTFPVNLLSKNPD